MSEDRRDKELQQELKRLGEPAADAEEIAAAERLAARMEGALHVVAESDDGDLSSLAQSLRISTGDASAGATATDRVLDGLFGDSDADAPADSHTQTDTHTKAEQDAPADELEQRRALALAAGVDRMIAGVLPVDAPADVGELLHVAALIRAASHATPLSARRLETLLEQAYGADAPAAATSPGASRGATVLRLALVAAMVVLMLGAGLVIGGIWAQRPDVSPRQLPTHLTSRSTRDILPGAFPRSQTAAERIDLIYHDRMRSYRELHLGTRRSPRSGRTP